MNTEELAKFLRLLRDVGCIDPYWKTRINNTILAFGGSITSPRFSSPPVEFSNVDDDQKVAENDQAV